MFLKSIPVSFELNNSRPLKFLDFVPLSVLSLEHDIITNNIKTIYDNRLILGIFFIIVLAIN
jgi:hypothetical protein